MSIQYPVYWHSVGSSATFSLSAIAPASGMLTASVPLFLSATQAADGTNYWTASVEVNTVDTTATSISNATVAFTANVDRELLLTERKVSKGDYIELVFTKAASAADLSAVTIDAVAMIVA